MLLGKKYWNQDRFVINNLLNRFFVSIKLSYKQDISNLRERHPWKQLNQLSCAESQVYFGGIVSVLPIAIDCAKSAYKRLRAIRAYREQANEYHFVENLKIQKDREAGKQFVESFV